MNKDGQIATGTDANGVQTSRDATAVDKAGGINVNVSLGSSSSQSNSSSTSNTARGSNVSAAGNVDIKATGAGQDSNLTAQGSTVNAGKTVTLGADNAVNLQAAANTNIQTSSNSGSNASVGAGFSTGSQSGITLNASVGRSQGNGNGQDLYYTNTQIKAGNAANIQSGGDTVLKGAEVSAKTVKAEVGGKLQIETLQDKSTYSESSSSSGAGVSLCIPPLCYGTSSANISASKTDIASNYRSANEQSGIKAGDGGFQVNVTGNTELKGGVIASTDKAIAENKNSLTTGTLTSSDLANEASASATTSGYSLSTDMASQGKYGMGKAALTNAMDNANQSSSSTGQTQSAISAGYVTITDDTKQKQTTGKDAATTVASLNRDTTGANTAAQKQDVQAMKQEVEAQRAIKAEVVQQASKFTDEAYRTMFIKAHKMYEVLKDKDGTTLRDEKTGRPMLRELSDAEKSNLKAGPDGKVHIAANGIFNDAQAAGTYADQHSNTTGPQYLIHFPDASNTVSELLVAGYQKFLEGDTLGLTNSTTQVKSAMGQYGATGLHLDGHSRGAMTVGNAMESQTTEPNAQGSLKVTTINFFGPAYNAQQADKLLGNLQDRQSLPADQQPATVLQFQNHAADPVGGLIGGNPPTGGTIPEGSSTVREAARAATGQENTVHNCYGMSRDAACTKFWDGSYPEAAPAQPAGAKK